MVRSISEADMICDFSRRGVGWVDLGIHRDDTKWVWAGANEAQGRVMEGKGPSHQVDNELFSQSPIG